MKKNAQAEGLNPERQRQAYTPPRLLRIELATDEMLGIGCKNAAQSALNTIACGVGVPCNLSGS